MLKIIQSQADRVPQPPPANPNVGIYLEEEEDGKIRLKAKDSDGFIWYLATFDPTGLTLHSIPDNLGLSVDRNGRFLVR